LLGWVALSCLCVLLTGSRTGFAGLVVLAVAAALATRYRKHFTLLAIVAAPLIWLSLSTELQNRYTTLIDPSVGPDNAKTSADSRKVFFWMAVEIWKEHPIFGIGPACFSIASGTGLQAHTLYAETLAELGLCGVVALSLMVLCYVFNYLEARRIYRAIPPPNDALFCYRIVQATSVTMLQLLFFGLGGHNLFRFTWLWYGAFAALALRFLREHYNDYVRGEQAAVDQALRDRTTNTSRQPVAMAFEPTQSAAGRLAI
jgi:O-antigen ligase